MEGKNIVQLAGYISYPDHKYTTTGKSRYQAKLIIPVKYTSNGEEREAKTFIPITAWGGYADSLYELGEGTAISVQGTLHIRNYDGKCPECASDIKKKWAEVVVSSFSVVEE